VYEREGEREGGGHVTPSNTHVLKLAERRYMTVGLGFHSISRDRKGGVPRNAEVCSAGLV
jgi:hypothetical protein